MRKSSEAITAGSALGGKKTGMDRSLVSKTKAGSNSVSCSGPKSYRRNPPSGRNDGIGGNHSNDGKGSGGRREAGRRAVKQAGGIYRRKNSNFYASFPAT